MGPMGLMRLMRPIMTQVQSGYGVFFTKICATGVLASIPTAAAYLLFQKKVTQGVMAATGLK